MSSSSDSDSDFGVPTSRQKLSRLKGTRLSRRAEPSPPRRTPAQSERNRKSAKEAAAQIRKLEEIASDYVLHTPVREVLGERLAAVRSGEKSSSTTRPLQGGGRMQQSAESKSKFHDSGSDVMGGWTTTNGASSSGAYGGRAWGSRSSSYKTSTPATSMLRSVDSPPSTEYAGRAERARDAQREEERQEEEEEEEEAGEDTEELRTGDWLGPEISSPPRDTLPGLGHEIELESVLGHVGIELGPGLTVDRLVPLSSSADSGRVFVGQELIKVDGQWVTGRDTGEVQLLLCGPVGTSVELTFKRLAPGPQGALARSSWLNRDPSTDVSELDAASGVTVILLRRPQSHSLAADLDAGPVTSASDPDQQDNEDEEEDMMMATGDASQSLSPSPQKGGAGRELELDAQLTADIEAQGGPAGTGIRFDRSAAGMPVARNVGRAFGGGFQVGEGSRGGEGEARGIQLSTSRIDGAASALSFSLAEEDEREKSRLDQSWRAGTVLEEEDEEGADEASPDKSRDQGHGQGHVQPGQEGQGALTSGGDARSQQSQPPSQLPSLAQGPARQAQAELEARAVKEVVGGVMISMARSVSQSFADDSQEIGGKGEKGQKKPPDDSAVTSSVVLQRLEELEGRVEMVSRTLEEAEAQTKEWRRRREDKDAGAAERLHTAERRLAEVEARLGSKALDAAVDTAPPIATLRSQISQLEEQSRNQVEGNARLRQQLEEMGHELGALRDAPPPPPPRCACAIS